MNLPTKIMLGVSVYVLAVAGGVAYWAVHTGYVESCMVVSSPETLGRDIARCMNWFDKAIR